VSSASGSKQALCVSLETRLSERAFGALTGKAQDRQIPYHFSCRKMGHHCIIGAGIFGLPGELNRLLGQASPFAVIFAALSPFVEQKKGRGCPPGLSGKPKAEL
jgi:hypothetical protein